MTSAPCAALGTAVTNSVRVALAPAYVLHRKPFRNTSALLEVFSREHGRLGLVARGVSRRGSRWQALLQPFVPLLLSWQGRGELYSLVGAEPAGRARFLPGREVLSGFYMNELLLRLTQRLDPHAGIFELYAQALAALPGGEHEVILRVFERGLLEELGYGLPLAQEAGSDRPVQPDAWYRYAVERGPEPCGGPEAGAVRGATLLGLAEGELNSAQARREAKHLMRAVLDFYLGDWPLKTRSMHWRREEH